MKACLVFLFFFAIACQKRPANIYDPLEKTRSVNEISLKVATRLKNENELYAFGTGGQMMNKVEMIALAFRHYKPVEIAEARRLLLNSVHVFLEETNKHKEIRSHLANYPCQPHNFHIEIFISDLNYSDFGPDKLCIASIIDGVLEYDINDPITNQLVTVHSETYEEAVRAAEELAQQNAI